MKQYIGFALKALTPSDEDGGSERAIRLVGQGECVYRVVSVAEVIKRRISDLQEEIELTSVVSDVEQSSGKRRFPVPVMSILLKASPTSRLTEPSEPQAAKEPKSQTVPVQTPHKPLPFHPKRQLLAS